MVYESLLLWPNLGLSITFAALFFCLAIINVVLTALVASEQITMLAGELYSKKESIRVELFLKTKDRPAVKDLDLKYENVSRKYKILTVVILIFLSAGLSMIDTSTT